MEIFMAEELYIELLSKGPIFTMVGDQIKEWFRHKDYGNSVHALAIGIICVHPRGNLFFKPRKRYKKAQKLIECDIKLDYDKVLAASSSELIAILHSAIIESLSIFETLKVKDFDAQAFREDLELFFASLKIE